MVRAVVIRAPGTNCDQELCRAFALAGAGVDLVHIDRVCEDPGSLAGFDILGFPGGFSYGDDIASGRVFAVKLRERVYPVLREAAARGCPMIGVCNGFQVLAQAGLLPGPFAGEPWSEVAPAQSIALTDNQDARFHDRWVGVEFNPSSVCIWTQGVIEELQDQTRTRLTHQLPAAHGEGRFVTAAPETLARLEENGQVVLRYTDNYNGSQGAVAGICDTSGRIFGLMPHPERFLDWNRHPAWTRLPREIVAGSETPGLKIFRAAVASCVSMAR
jgi:phosphoribosylformylglycinamidine synthase I